MTSLHERPGAWPALVLAACLPPIGPTASARAPTENAPAVSELLDGDATLNDVCFVDRRHGWAVGDRGVILRTVDGGANWRRLETPVATPLDSVCFTDDRHGWAVGGEARPHTHDLLAVILKTEDGGDTWRQLPAPLLPMLRGVTFLDERRGVVHGARTPLATTGVFATEDGGRGWHPLSVTSPQNTLPDTPRSSPEAWPPAQQRGHWLAAAWSAPGAGVLVRDDGALFHARQKTLRPAPAAGAAIAARAVAGEPGGTFWAAGGGVLLSTSGGRRWSPPATPPPKPFDEFHWRAVAARGQHVWLAGSPGSAVAASPDGGRTWRVQPTGAPAALTAVEFVDERHGWAVGEFGAIVATADGGRTWRPQRGAGRRAAVLVVTETPAAAPLELIAKLGAAEGYRVAVQPLGCERGEEVSGAEARLRQAATWAGASVVEPMGIGAEANDRAALVRRLGDTLRRLRPELVLVAVGEGVTPSRGSTRGLRAMVDQALAAAAEIHPAGSGLANGELPQLPPPHEPRRVAYCVPDGQPATGRVATGDYHPALGATFASWVGYRRGLLHRSPRPQPSAVAWRLGAARGGPPLRGRDPMAGIALQPGGPSRRPPAKQAASGLAELRELAVRRRSVQELLAAQPGEGEERALWQRQVVDLTSGLSADAGAQLLHQMATEYVRRGDPQRAADTHYLLLVRYTNHPLADSSLVWVLRYYASSEVAHAASLASQRPVKAAADGVVVATYERPGSSPPRLDAAERARRALQLADYLEKSRPTLFARPELRRVIAAAAAAAGEAGVAEKTNAVLGGVSMPPAWRAVANAETWLAGRRATDPPAGVLPASESAAPLIDGRLDDPCWRMDGVGSAETRAWFACDADYFYFAGHCTKGDGVAYPESPGPRTRDADLSAYDRVALSIDTDRDYASAFELTIDSRGWTADRCWAGQAWDPRWYVAVAQTDAAWTYEAAIAKAELRAKSGGNAANGDAWAVAIERRIPGHRPARWPAEAGVTGPTGWKLLLAPVIR